MNLRAPRYALALSILVCMALWGVARCVGA